VKYIGLVMVTLTVVLILVFRSLRTRKPSGNVIKFQKKKNSKPDFQKCTYCKKMSKLIFYASDDGTVVGVCKECKPKADSKDMLPI
jgi:hypothetical protein